MYPFLLKNLSPGISGCFAKPESVGNILKWNPFFRHKDYPASLHDPRIIFCPDDNAFELFLLQ
jgi:hypothetical protein